VSELVSLNVPPNVSLLSGLQVSVTIKIEPIQGARTVTSKIEVIGVPVGVRATPSPTTVDIVLAGSLPLLNSLKDQDVRVIIDAKDLKAGINVVEPQVVRPDGITVQSIQPATIQVELTSQN
jgi:YbbR domain-containing protein